MLRARRARKKSRTHPTSALSTQHGDNLATPYPHLGLQLGFEIVHGGVNPGDELAQLLQLMVQQRIVIVILVVGEVVVVPMLEMVVRIGGGVETGIGILLLIGREIVLMGRNEAPRNCSSAHHSVSLYSCLFPRDQSQIGATHNLPLPQHRNPPRHIYSPSHSRHPSHCPSLVSHSPNAADGQDAVVPRTSDHHAGRRSPSR